MTGVVADATFRAPREHPAVVRPPLPRLTVGVPTRTGVCGVCGRPVGWSPLVGWAHGTPPRRSHRIDVA